MNFADIEKTINTLGVKVMSVDVLYVRGEEELTKEFKPRNRSCHVLQLTVFCLFSNVCLVSS